MRGPVSSRLQYNLWFATRTSFLFLIPFSVVWHVEISTKLPTRFGTERSKAPGGKNRNISSSLPTAESERLDAPSKLDVSDRLKIALDSHPECRGKERVVEILLKAGKPEIRKEECAFLPTWDEVTSLYGEKPIVHGLETCQQYRDILARAGTNGTAKEPEPRVAGLFNTGTNALTDSLQLNFRKLESRDVYNLLGGKHVNLRYRNWAQTIDDHGGPYKRDKSLFAELPVVLIRDPFRWMGSMCKSPYNVTWRRGAFERCPSLMPSQYELRSIGRINDKSNPFEVRLDRSTYIERYDSLAHMWSDWYLRFFNATFPRLIIRFEDTLFHGEEVFKTVMECIGRPMSEPYKYELEASKFHGASSDFVHALAKYGTEKGRYTGLLPDDRLYAQTTLDSTLMKTFSYSNAPLSMKDDYIIEEEQVSGLEKYPECKGKKRLLGSLLRAGVEAISRKSCRSLPTWSDISSTYGRDPVAIGVETCMMYRKTFGVGVISKIRIVGLSSHLQRSFVRWLSEHLQDAEIWKNTSISLGLHTPFERRGYWAQFNRSSSLPPTFPIVLAMDPFRFMSDKCDKPAGLKWSRGWHSRCPNLVPTEFERKVNPEAFSAIDTFTVATLERNYDSLADLWVSWIRNAVNSSRPRLIVRVEDALFHPEKVLEVVSTCVGAKKKENSNDSLLDRSALEAYGKERLKGLTPDDRLYAHNVLPEWLMQALKYRRVTADGSVAAYDEQFSGLEAHERVCDGKKKLLGILARAGKQYVSPKDCNALPQWSSFAALYGNEPVVLGLERCEQYRALEARSGARSFHVSVESLPHSGAAALAEALRLNIGNISILTDVSGDEQSFMRQTSDKGASELPVLPLIVVRDPYRWMQKMCQAPYNANWTRGDRGRCPNFVPSTAEKKDHRYSNLTTFYVDMTYNDGRWARYNSVADLWSSYYRSHTDADYPRLVVRFEDLVFHAERVMELVSDCIGSPLKIPYEYSLPHRSLLVGDRHGRILKLYASEEGRYTHLTKEDLTYQRFALSPSLLTLFQYKRFGKVLTGSPGAWNANKA